MFKGMPKKPFQKLESKQSQLSAENIRMNDQWLDCKGCEADM
jgi:hypothetical protein